MGCTSSKNTRILGGTREWNAPLLRSMTMPVRRRRWKRKESQHLVALTSTTYGVLRLLDLPDQDSPEAMTTEDVQESYESLWSLSLQSTKAPKNWSKACFLPEIRSVIEDVYAYKPEIINTAELMAGLEDECLSPPSSFTWCKAKMYTRSFSLSSIPAVHKLDAVLRRHAKPSAVLAKYHSCIALPKTLCLHRSDEENSKPLFADPSPAGQFSSPSPVTCTSKRSSSKKKSKRNAASALPFTPLKSSLAQKLGLCSANIQSNPKSSSARKKSIDNETPECMPLMSIENTVGNRITASSICTVKKAAKKKRATPEKSSQTKCYAENLPPQLTVSKSYHTILSDGTEEIESPIFDPELLQNFERAVEQIGSDEKWLSSTLGHNLISPSSCSHEEEATPLKPKHLMLFGGLSASKRNRISDSGRGEDHLTVGTELGSMELYVLDSTTHYFKEDVLEDKHQQLKRELKSFPWLCPPAGENSVVLYSTSLHGIRKTFEDCNSLQGILRGFGVHVDERDVSMHSGFLQELKNLMREKTVTVPRLFIKGHYIGGVEEAQQLHEDGKLANLLEGIRKEDSSSVCDGCGGMRFIPCLDCSGSCKIITDGNEVVRCPDCNENGLIRCPICC
ncbi:hypothetical protein O6H91_07G099400 [Diphasiastrum complanatum]|uniref:Uncharacterized protein n=1 Tax=Diphasiastrum complanatum TaxID=34168 RepID=A0ACC2D8W8_DIPCM|nr:hypothetical protein O6H91_07G099400 [Diphasiastrum complanatum]